MALKVVAGSDNGMVKMVRVRAPQGPTSAGSLPCIVQSWGAPEKEKEVQAMAWNSDKTHVCCVRCVGGVGVHVLCGL